MTANKIGLLAWKEAYSEAEGTTSIRGYVTEKENPLSDYLRHHFQERIEHYTGSDALRAAAESLDSTGFLSEAVEDALASDLSKDVWGECFAYEQLESYLGVELPFSPLWDKRTEKSSLPGADIVGFDRHSDGTPTFVFGEVKTSEERRYPPTLVTNPRKGLIIQLNSLDDRRKVLHLIKWLTMRSCNSTWESDFKKALDKYLRKRDFIRIGVLVRDTPSDKRDLLKAMESLSRSSIKSSLYAFYLPICFGDCMRECRSGGVSNVSS